MNCRHCRSPLQLQLIDLGSSPPSNAYLTKEKLSAPERWYPLKVMVCERCWLVQTRDFTQASELFDSEYAYFSGFSTSWLQHAERYVDAMVRRFDLHAASRVIEVASNDGYLLQYVQARGIPCLGVEPTASTAAASRRKGIETLEVFFGRDFGRQLAEQGRAADLMAANNVLAHVPDINDFLAGFAAALKPQGAVTFEFPHLQRLIDGNQFDTIYHEHFSYLSLTTVQQMCASNGLQVFDVEELPTHGGSLRVYTQRADTGKHPVHERVRELERAEIDAGLRTAAYYRGFQQRAERVKDDLMEFLIAAKRGGKSVIAYGAAAKGNTLLNFAGCRGDLIRYVVDRNDAKQGKFMPGSRIPIMDDSVIVRDKPDYIVILPWNLRTEVTQQLAGARQWGAQFVTAVPKLEIS
ncbi:class I SAM-dependent methyltransferase [Peristeroidobacter soli]|jgi:hypothetical protein|uniref:class I SAM-dependent methyltransferase n=1 Tax=Peristeroidobacter soli TaxID=2497877 RepID=UPI00101D2BC3|nr:class I SAM-dependent methyltransferase [Peristeroidobacter soli]